EIDYLDVLSGGFFYFLDRLREEKFDVVYLNSLFSWKFSIRYLLMRKVGLVPSSRVILAVRGELSPGARKIRGFKKSCFLWLASFLSLYEGVVFQASSDLEKQDIENFLGLHHMDTKVLVASDLIWIGGEADQQSPKKVVGELKVVFLSRITPMKNLECVLETLRHINSPLSLDIYGPITEGKDAGYFAACMESARGLTDRHQVEYKGVVSADQVIQVLSQYHVLFLPTRGENFGHIIIEALQAGCLPLISDKTPWSDIDKEGAGVVVQGDHYKSYLTAIERLMGKDEGEWLGHRQAMNRYLDRKLTVINQLEPYKRLLDGDG
ncbi:MAG: glycosyltransferase family 4 protein, partial [Bdellovibrionales bacterium]|nr:glycosyltransferase family 4 protein [Bdellovibrionales bacterium]